MKIPVLELLYNLLHRNDEKHQITMRRKNWVFYWKNAAWSQVRQVIGPVNKTTKVGHLDIQKVVATVCWFFRKNWWRMQQIT